MELQQLRDELRTVADDDAPLTHAERMAGTRERVRRSRRRRTGAWMAAAALLVVVVPVAVSRGGDDAGPAARGSYDGAYPGPETFDALAVDGTCPTGGQPGSGSSVPVGPDAVPAERATVLVDRAEAAVAAVGGEQEVVVVERTATSLSPGAPPCGPSYGVLLGGRSELDAELLLTLSWAGDDRLAALGGCAPEEAASCVEQEGEGWRAAVRADDGRGRPLVVATLSTGEATSSTPVVAVRSLRGRAPSAEDLLEVALAEDWHRLAEEVEAQVGG